MSVPSTALLALPSGPFRCIVADPPWDYREYGCHDGPPKPWHDVNMGWKCVADMGYPTMKTMDIVAMPVAAVADTNAHLYCWTTNKFLREAHEVAEAWGFRPVTLLTWGKVKEDGSASMMTAASTTVKELVPKSQQELVMAYAAASNLITTATGMYMSLYMGIPLTNWLYKKLSGDDPAKPEMEG